MAGSIAPYSPAETREAHAWLDYVDAALEPETGDPVATICEAIDKAERRGALSPGAAALLSEIFDVPHRGVAYA